MNIEVLARQYPRTIAAFGEHPLERLLELEQSFGQQQRLLQSIESADGGGGEGERFDVVLAGGGLSLLYAAALAQAGLRVGVFDRRRIGCGHREWNISFRELGPLVESGLFTEGEVAGLVRARYRVGICKFGTGRAYPVRGVLDCVIDAEGILEGLRERALRAGVTLFEHHGLVGYRASRGEVAVEIESLRNGGIRRRLGARLLIDALGAGSPHARFDLCCPTVGGVMEGLGIGAAEGEMDPEVGEILVTTEGVEDGQQHIWEGFPAPPTAPASTIQTTPASSGRMTIYLFYYQRAERVAAMVREGGHPLLALYERFFETLPRYKSGALRMARPTYGYIPGYTRLGEMPASPGERVLLVGDAAGRHSPLTFCGFGSMMRSFWPITQRLVQRLREDRLGKRELEGVWAGIEPPALQVMGGLTLMMIPPPPRGDALEEPDGINELLDAAFAALAGLGEGAYAAFLRDEVDAQTFLRFMLDAAARHPAVYRKVFAHLQAGEAAAWLLRMARFRYGGATRGGDNTRA